MKLRKWVKVVLATISTLSFIVMAGDCESTLYFIVSHLIACLAFTLSTMTLIRFSKIYE